MDLNLIKEIDNQNNSLIESLEILAEMTRADIERSSYYFDIDLKFKTRN